MIELTIYVPAPGTYTHRQVKRGAGIVGSKDPLFPGEILIDYEGALYNAGMSWEDKIFHAAGRHHWKRDAQGRIRRYPTVARSLVKPEEVVAVGTFRCADDWKDREYVITNQAALDEWRNG